MPNRHLPFLLPLTNLPGREIDNILVVQLDIGYLAVLLQHIDLGGSGLVRLLQDDGLERVRIDSSGVVAGDALLPGLPDSGSEAGMLTQYAAGAPTRACTGACPSGVSAWWSASARTKSSRPRRLPIPGSSG